MHRLFSQPRSAVLCRALSLAAGLAALGANPWTARAQYRAERVTTAAEPDNPFDLKVGLAYDFSYQGLGLRREWALDGRRKLARDLLYRQLRHSLVPSLEVGVFRGLAVYLELPVVLSDQRDYRFDRSSSDCVDPGQASAGQVATCVDKTNSSTLRDGIVPTGGFSANRSGGPFLAYPAADTGTIFRGPQRRGLDQLHVGLKYAILRQDKIAAFPTWLLGFESRIGIGKEQTMQKLALGAPASNDAVGRKVHEFGVWTSVHRRYRFIQPYASAYARWAVAAKNSAMGRIRGPAIRDAGPSNHMGANIGAMIVPWVQPERGLRFAIELQGNFDYTGRGHAYSQAWELLADSPALLGAANPAQGPCNVAAGLQFAALNPNNPSDYLKAANAGTANGECVAFSGITRVDAFATLGGTLNFRLSLGPWAELNLGSTLSGSTQHMLTGESMGVPSVSGDPNLVELDSPDIDPQRRDVIDRPGRRYAADDIFNARVHARLNLTF